MKDIQNNFALIAYFLKKMSNLNLLQFSCFRLCKYNMPAACTRRTKIPERRQYNTVTNTVTNIKS